MGTTNKSSCKTAAVMNLLGRGPAADQDVRVLPDEPQRIEALSDKREDERLAELAANIRAAERRNQQLAQLMLDNAVDIGRWLMEVKAMVPHGQWGKWLKENVDYSQSKAQNLMRLYQEYGTGRESLSRGAKSQALGILSVTKALQLLAIPDGSEREKFLEEHDVASMTTRELDSAIKERDEALKAAEQAKAEQAAAEQAREKMAADMALANERLLERDAEVQEQGAKLNEARGAVARLEQELEELRSRPRDVAVEVDTAAVEAARKEAEERMQAQLDAAKKSQAEAEKARKAAEDAKADVQMELKRANAKLEDVRIQAEEARKKAVVASDADLVLFSELLDQTQTLLKRMGGVRLKKLAQNDSEVAQKLHVVIMDLIPFVKEAAGDD